MLANPVSFLFSPRKQWQQLAQTPNTKLGIGLIYPLVMALLPCIAWYIGTTEVGWSVTSDDITKLTPDSALKMIIAFYIVMVACIFIIGYSIHWMSSTYTGVNKNNKSDITKGIAIAGFTATPLFLAGLIGFYPILWVDLLLGIFALSWAVYLLYIGIPIVMDIPQEQGFLYASAVIAVCMVLLMVIMGGSVILWDFGFTPVFTD